MKSNSIIGAFCVIAAVGSAGCTLGDYNSIHRSFWLPLGNSHFVDIKQRSVLVSKRSANDGNGEKGMRRPIVCAEPSPDALSVYSSAMAAAAQHPSGASGNFSYATGESGTAFGLRTQSIQLLRDAYYRACEAYMSQSIDRETYDVMVRRLNNQAIGYLAIEQITSGEAVQAAAKADAPDLDKPTKDVKAAEDAVAAAEAKKKAAQADLDKAKSSTPPADAAKIKELEGAVSSAGEGVTTAKASLAKANDALLAAAKQKVAAPEKTAKAGAVGERAVAAAENIALSIIDADYSPQMCFSHKRQFTAAAGQTDPLGSYCDGILEMQGRAFAADVKREEALNAAVDTLCSGDPGHGGSAAGCAAVVTTLLGSGTSTSVSMGNGQMGVQSLASPRTPHRNQHISNDR